MVDPDCPKLHFISSTEYDNLARQLALQILDDGVEATKLVAINRGGARPAQFISDLVGLRFLSVDGKSYLDVEKRGQITELQALPRNSINKDDVVVLIDEICDEGVTLKHYKQTIEALTEGCTVLTAAVFARSASQHLVDYVAKIVDVWIVFPNEFRETIKSLHKWWSVDLEYKNLIINGFVEIVQIPPEMVERVFAEVEAEHASAVVMHDTEGAR